MFPVALSLGGLLVRVAALAVIPRVIARLSPGPRAEVAPEITLESRVQEAPAVVEPILKVRQVAPTRWQDLALKPTENTSLLAWRSPASARAPPFAGTQTGSRAYLHRRSYPINFSDPEGLAPFGGNLVVYSSSHGGMRQAYRVRIDGNYDPSTGRVDAYLDTRNLLLTDVRVKITLSIQQISAGEPGKITSSRKRKRGEGDRCFKTSDSSSRSHTDKKNQASNNEHYTAKIDPASLVRIRVDAVVDPFPLVGGNPFSFGGLSTIHFTQGSNTFTSEGFHMGDNIVDINDL